MADYTCQSIRPAGTWAGSFEVCVLTYDERFLRRKVIRTAHDETLLVDLAQATSVEPGDAFELTDGRIIECFAADEALYKVTGYLPLLAYHIGNRHTPCQIENDHLLIQRDHVLKDMIARLKGRVEEFFGPFAPEGGAYGYGRTHGHDHGHVHVNASDHDHGH